MRNFICNTVMALAVVAVLCSCQKPEEEKTSEQLAAPELTVDKSVVSETGFTVVWEAVENAAGYVYILNDRASVITTECEAVFTDLTPGTNYTVKVKAVAAEGNGWLDSDWAELVVTTLPNEPEPPAEPEKLETPKLSGEQQGEMLVISWNAVENAASYRYDINGSTPEVTENTSFTIVMADLGVGQHSVSVTALPEEGSEEYLESDPAVLEFSISGGDEPGDGALSEWIGAYTLTSTQTIAFINDEGTLVMELLDEPMTLEITIEECPDPTRVFIYGLSELEGYPLMGALFEDEEGVRYLGVLTENEIIGRDEDGTNMVGLPICESSGELIFVTGTPYAFLLDPVTMKSMPYTGNVGDEQFTVAGIDIFGMAGDGGVSLYYPEYPAYIPGGIFTLEKTDSHTGSVLSCSIRNLEPSMKTAFRMRAAAVRN